MLESSRFQQMVRDQCWDFGVSATYSCDPFKTTCSSIFRNQGLPNGCNHNFSNIKVLRSPGLKHDQIRRNIKDGDKSVTATTSI